MKYEKARQQIRSGDLLAFYPNSLGGKIVSSWTNSRISHVGMSIWIGPRLFCIEALPGVGVTLSLLSKRLPCEWTPLFIEPEDWKQAEDFALCSLGAEYSWLDAIKAGLGLKPSKWNGKQCAEFVLDVYKKTPLPQFCHIDTLSPIPENVQHEFVRCIDNTGIYYLEK